VHIVFLNILVYLILFFNPCLQLICILTISVIAFPFLVTLKMLTDGGIITICVTKNIQ